MSLLRLSIDQEFTQRLADHRGKLVGMSGANRDNAIRMSRQVIDDEVGVGCVCQQACLGIEDRANGTRHIPAHETSNLVFVVGIALERPPVRVDGGKLVLRCLDTP